MARFVSGGDLVTTCSAGRGAIVLVEGETDEHDPYFYRRWFGDLAREVSFFPQNGWARVVEGVAHLRATFPTRSVFGIVDRDFADEAVLTAQDATLPPDGVFRTRRFTNENYLLDPSGWLEVVQVLYRQLPAPWASEAEVAARIEAAYRQCIPVAAWNLLMHSEHRRLPGTDLQHRKHPDAIPADCDVLLRELGERRGAPESLDRVFATNVARIEAMQPREWPQWISGKPVLSVLRASLPGPTVPRDVLLNLYLRVQPRPADDLRQIVERIVATADSPY